MEHSGRVLLGVQIKLRVLFLDVLGGSPARPLTINDLAAGLTKAGVLGWGDAAPVTAGFPRMRERGGSLRLLHLPELISRPWKATRATGHVGGICGRGWSQGASCDPEPKTQDSEDGSLGDRVRGPVPVSWDPYLDFWGMSPWTDPKDLGIRALCLITLELGARGDL